MNYINVITSFNHIYSKDIKFELTNYSWLQINEDGSWYVFASAGLAEEGVERIITASDGLVTGHLTIRLDTVLQAVQLPAGITHLDSGLADMDRDTFPLKTEK